MLTESVQKKIGSVFELAKFVNEKKDTSHNSKDQKLHLFCVSTTKF